MEFNIDDFSDMVPIKESEYSAFGLKIIFEDIPDFIISQIKQLF